MCVVNTAECLSQAENGRQQLHVAYGICGGEYSPFSLSLWVAPYMAMIRAQNCCIATQWPKSRTDAEES